jgi:hypothetical protein
MEKTIKAKCPFPFVKLNVNLKYAELQKPTGVRYIILVLIETKNREEKIGEILKQFGIPEEIQFIFSDDIELLLSRKILSMRQGLEYERSNLDQYEIRDFEFTKDGKRMFHEGSISTGELKSKQKPVYFDPLTSKFSYSSPSAYTSIDKLGCFPEGFMEKIQSDFPGLKGFIDENIKGTGLQKDEKLLDCGIIGREDLLAKTEDNLELRINNDGMEAIFKTEEEKNFYEKYFSADMLEKQLNDQEKFQFSYPVTSVFNFSPPVTLVYEGFSAFQNLSAVYLPQEYEKQKSRPAKLLVFRKNINDEKIIVKREGTETVLENGEMIASAIGRICSEWAYITVDSKEMRFYTAACVKLNERVINKPIDIHLLVEQLYAIEQKQEIITAIYKECAAAGFSPEYCRLINVICGLLENEKLITDYMELKLKEAVNIRRVEILCEASGIFKNPEWTAKAKIYADGIYRRLISMINEQNAEYIIKTARTLDGIRKPEKDALLLDVSKELKKYAKDEIALFNLIMEAGFSENDALSEANAVRAYMDKILSGETELTGSKISGNFSLLAMYFNALIKNLGITNTEKYKFREDYKIDEFVKNFIELKKIMQDMKKYAGFAQDRFGELEKYKEIMQPVFDYVMNERNASRNPSKINKKEIQKDIENKYWHRAIADMFKYLEYILGKRLEVEGDGTLTVFEKINAAKKAELLTESQTDILHELREFRNKLFHATEKQVVFDREKITKWADAVFAVSEKPEKKEEKK